MSCSPHQVAPVQWGLCGRWPQGARGAVLGWEWVVGRGFQGFSSLDTCSEASRKACEHLGGSSFLAQLRQDGGSRSLSSHTCSGQAPRPRLSCPLPSCAYLESVLPRSVPWLCWGDTPLCIFLSHFKNRF